MIFTKRLLRNLNYQKKRKIKIIPQFDILTLGAQVFGLLVTLSFFYYFSISIVIPSFIEVKKFRTKKLTKNTNSISIMTLDLTNNKKLINISYKLFMQQLKMGV